MSGITINTEDALRASALFDKPSIFITSANVAENDMEETSRKMALNVRFKEVLLLRALQKSNQLLNSSFISRNKRSNVPLSVDFDAVVNCEVNPSVFERYQVSHASYGGYGLDIADSLENEEDLALLLLARELTLFGCADLTSITSDDETLVLEVFDEFEDWLLETLTEDELDDLKSEVMDICIAYSKYAKAGYSLDGIGASSKGTLKCVAHRTLEHILKNSRCSGNLFLKEADILRYFGELLCNFVDLDYDGDRLLYIQRDIPKIYLHPQNYKDTPEKAALIKAVDYFLKPNKHFAPGTIDFSFINEDYLAVCVCFGGFCEEGYCVEANHLAPWWELSKLCIEKLLPIVVEQHI